MRRAPGIFTALLAGLVCWLCAAGAAEWKEAVPGWKYAFPRDHGPHADFKTEWWYFTGNLVDEKGRRFGYELTLFRQGVRPPGQRETGISRFVVNDLKFAHFALSDVADGKFHFFQKLSRGAFGEAGFGEAPGRLAWIEDWSIEMDGAGVFHLRATQGGITLDLALSNAKPWTIQGVDGVSRKSAIEGHASHYYSGTRLGSTGVVGVGGRSFKVSGESWFDHEWATNQLAPGQVGWNWFSLQLADGTDLMLYQMRLENGGIDAASSGTFVAVDGTTRHLNAGDYELVPGKTWTSKANGARYPIDWQLKVPSLSLDLRVTTPLPNQELTFGVLAYWEGLVDAEGTREGRPVKGHGYLEMTGYAGKLQGLSK